MRCRTAFTTFNRKHHCRNCGQTFCQSCSSKTLPLPHLGITEDVRVCDTCHNRLTAPKQEQYFGSGSGTATPSSRKTPLSRSDSVQSVNRDADQNLIAKREQEDLERAIAASLRESSSSRNNYSGSNNKSASHASSNSNQRRQDYSSKHSPEDEEEDEDLKAAIEASMKELRISEERRKQQEQYTKNNSKHSNFHSENISFRDEQISELPNPMELGRVEIDNLKLFADLVERMEADVAVRGIGVLHHSQISV